MATDDVAARLDTLLKEVMAISNAVARVETIAAHSITSHAETKAKLATIEAHQTDLRVAVGKLEVKNGIVATVLGCIAGVFGSMFRA